MMAACTIAYGEILHRVADNVLIQSIAKLGRDNFTRP